MIIVETRNDLPWQRLQDMACDLNYTRPEWLASIEFTVDGGKHWNIWDAMTPDQYQDAWLIKIRCEDPDGEERWLEKKLDGEDIRRILLEKSRDGKYNRHFRAWIFDNADWETADSIFQLLAYGEIVFG